MEQGQARARAKELGGIATQARISPSTGKWIIGGWPNKNTVWIVVSLDFGKVLAS